MKGAKMKSICGVFLLCVLSLAAMTGRGWASGSGSDKAGTPVGLWLTQEGDAHVRVSSCGQGLCGQIVWLSEPNDERGKPKLDDKNPDPALRDRAVIGLKILDGFHPDPEDPSRWVDGSIYDPKSGNSYSANITVNQDGSLYLRGYVGIPLLGRTAVWQPIKE